MDAATKKSAEDGIAFDPFRWPVVQGTGGCRKARIALPGRGKSGGARVIYFFAAENGALVFIDVYAKNEKEDLSAGDKRALRDFARTFQA
ncbi:MAG: type II toxin-antitoxin system RelE/ParE family toxin [Tagaea sp.]|nr:type II toxin-antitoxin system RelE/ParE family toxin [Tagaea sp.]